MLTLVLHDVFLDKSHAYFSIVYANFSMLNEAKPLLMQTQSARFPSHRLQIITRVINTFITQVYNLRLGNQLLTNRPNNYFLHERMVDLMSLVDFFTRLNDLLDFCKDTFVRVKQFRSTLKVQFEKLTHIFFHSFYS